MVMSMHVHEHGGYVHGADDELLAHAGTARRVFWFAATSRAAAEVESHRYGAAPDL